MIPETLVIGAALATGWFVLSPLFRSSGSMEKEMPAHEARSRRTEALAAIVELEDDLSMGKLTEGDFADLKARYEADAIEALRTERLAQADEDALEEEIAMAKRRL